MMRVLAGSVVLAIMLTAVNVLAAQVYLKDGAVVDCQSFWQKSGTVYVKVNRDVLLEFGSGEVDLKKTFHPHRAGKRTVRPPAKKVTVKPKPAQQPPAPAAGQTTPAKPVAAPPAPKAPAVPKAASPAPPAAAPKPVVPPAQKSVQPGGAKPAAPPVAAPVRPPLPERKIVPRPAPAPVPPTSLLATMGVGVLLLPLAIIVLYVASSWIIFVKAGEPGWGAIIPIYNMVVLLRIAGKPVWWVLLFFVPLVGLIFYLLTCLALAQKFSKSPIYGVLLCFFGFIMFPLLAFDKTATYTP